jgi:hypothetical protein
MTLVAQVARLDHHLEGARIEEVAHQHRGGVAELRVGGLAAAAQGRLVDDVVVQEGGRVDELDDRGHLVPRVGAGAQGPGREQQQGGPDALAAGIHDVLPDGAHQGHVGMQAPADDLVHPHEIVVNGGPDRLEAHGGYG